jgi:hypothetical protein
MSPIAKFTGIMFCSVITACANTSSSSPQQSGEWRSLFDGRTTNGWRGYQSQTMPAGWQAVDGILTKTGSSKDIVTTEQFADFELRFEWKLEPGGNAGFFYRATEEYDRIYWSAAEYQLLDDALAPDGRSRMTAAGAAHSIAAAPAGVVKPGGEWNSTRVVVNGSHVEHWLNGQKLFEFELWSPDWEARVKASKFRDWPNFGRARRGYIGFQGDHEGVLQLRDIQIKLLDGR